MMGLDELQSVQENLMKQLKTTTSLIESRRTETSDHKPTQPKVLAKESSVDRMSRIREQAKHELKGFLDE